MFSFHTNYNWWFYGSGEDNEVSDYFEKQLQMPDFDVYMIETANLQRCLLLSIFHFQFLRKYIMYSLLLTQENVNS